jgi:hypothetical protein
MAPSKSSAERMRKLRDRKRCGTVVVQDIQIKRNGIETLIARGWLDAEAGSDPAQVRAALIEMINNALSESPEPKRHGQPGRRFQALRSIAFGLF